MEIVKHIWILLILTNASLISVFSILFSTIELFIYSLIISALSKAKISFKRRILFVVILVLENVLIISIVPAPYYTFINLLFAIILSMFILKTSLFYAFLANICFYIVTFLFSIIWLTTYTLLFNCSSNEIQQILLYKVIFASSVDISYYVFYKFCIKHPLNIKFSNKLEKHLLLFCNISLCLSTIVLQFFIAYLYFDRIPLVLNILSTTLLLAYFATSIYSLRRTSNLETTTLLLAEEKLHNKNLSTINDSIRGFKHDFNNIVQTIGGYIAEDNMEELKTYYKDLFGDCQNNNALSILTPEAINNPTLYNLLTNKYYDALNADVPIDFTILTSDLSDLNIKSYELSRILGILLDNAIEASAKTKNKLVHVTLKKDKNVNRHLIIIENTYTNKDVDINKIFVKGYSSKEDKEQHGIGLWEVNNYINKRKNLNLTASKNDEYFIQQFEIYDD